MVNDFVSQQNFGSLINLSATCAPSWVNYHCAVFHHETGDQCTTGSFWDIPPHLHMKNCSAQVPLSLLSQFPQGPPTEPAQLQLLKLGTELGSLPLRYMRQEHGKVNREAGGNGAYSLSGPSFLLFHLLGPQTLLLEVVLSLWVANSLGGGWSPKTIGKHRYLH